MQTHPLKELQNARGSPLFAFFVSPSNKHWNIQESLDVAATLFEVVSDNFFAVYIHLGSRNIRRNTCFSAMLPIEDDSISKFTENIAQKLLFDLESVSVVGTRKTVLLCQNKLCWQSICVRSFFSRNSAHTSHFVSWMLLRVRFTSILGVKVAPALEKKTLNVTS